MDGQKYCIKGLKPLTPLTKFYSLNDKETRDDDTHYYTGVPARVTTPHRVEVTTLTHPHSKQLMANRSVNKAKAIFIAFFKIIPF